MDDTFTALPREQIEQFHNHLHELIYPSCWWLLVHFGVEDEDPHGHVFGLWLPPPLAHKIAVARALLTQADRIRMSVPDKDMEKRLLTQALSSNG